ncbi:hypothetical protein EIP86_007445 [Pleurotus ostreatoroseus]|nr:hypothetical protein EIP86_007445 [Pleurotus ostreatoroseus]
MSDRGYFNLLNHLARPATALPPKTLQASIAHYLAYVQPSPTPLAGSVVSSLHFRSSSHPKLDALQTAFRHAVHFKIKLLEESKGGIFTLGINSRVGAWISGIIEGLNGGNAVLRLACTSGLLLGMGDWESQLTARKGKIWTRVEEEIIVALAEIMEFHAHPPTAWEREFALDSEAAQSLPLIDTRRLTALPLAALSRLLLSKIDTRPEEAWSVMSETLYLLNVLTSTVEADWIKSALASVIISDEDAIASEARKSLTIMWTILKTLLFTTIRLVQATLSVVVHVPQPHIATASTSTPPTTTSASPSALSLTTLHILSHLSFVLPQFGGVASTSNAEGGFPELKRAFYTALDILSADSAESARFVRELRETFAPSSSKTSQSGNGWPTQFTSVKKAYALACVEQLVPVLGDESAKVDVYPLCAPDRELFESAHSVILALFAASADRNDKSLRGARTAGPAAYNGDGSLTFAQEFVPAHTQCLLENAADGKLNVVQLSLAFRALVRCAGALGPSSNLQMLPMLPNPETVKPSTDENENLSSDVLERTPLSQGDTLACYCIFSLLQKMKLASNPGERHRLSLALVSSVSAVSLALLPRVLESVRDVIEAINGEEDDVEHRTVRDRNARRRRELVDALFEEIAQRTGDLEKEYAVRWWYDNRGRLLGEEAQDGGVLERILNAGYLDLKGKGKELMARL